MAKQKQDPICSAYEFTIRRQAVGLDNATMIELTGFSVSSLTKWSSGAMPVSFKALAAIERVEIAFENEVQRLVDQMEEIISKDAESKIIAYDKNWEFGSKTYEIVAARANRILSDAVGRNIGIMPPSE